MAAHGCEQSWVQQVRPPGQLVLQQRSHAYYLNTQVNAAWQIVCDDVVPAAAYVFS